MLHIYDVSAYQGTTVPACDAVFVKATEGKSYSSSKFAAQWKSAQSRAKVRGAYHFARPEDSSGSSQADRLLAAAKAVPGEMLCLDLEASDLSQSKTNAWAREFGDRLREKAPGITTVVYLGSGYASNGTGKGLADHFDLWWYPQYPSAYQSVPSDGFRISHDEEAQRAENRSEAVSGRILVARTTTKWPTSVSPWLPSGITTGWSKPHLWQFTDNFNGLDASISTLTLEQLAGGKVPDPKPAGPPKWPGRYLKVANPLMRGSDVKWVQQHLNSHGASPKVTVDSQYGPKTRDAVKTFQRKQKLEADGIVGKLTWAALGK